MGKGEMGERVSLRHKEDEGEGDSLKRERSMRDISGQRERVAGLSRTCKRSRSHSDMKMRICCGSGENLLPSSVPYLQLHFFFANLYSGESAHAFVCMGTQVRPARFSNRIRHQRYAMNSF